MKRLPDPKPVARIIDGTAEPLDMEPTEENYCPVCGRTTFEWHRHHVVSRGQGGDDVPENLVWVCPSCHDLLHHSVVKLSAVAKVLLVAYVRTLPETLEYCSAKKYPGYLEDRYLGVRL